MRRLWFKKEKKIESLLTIIERKEGEIAKLKELSLAKERSLRNQSNARWRVIKRLSKKLDKMAQPKSVPQRDSNGGK